MTDEYLPEPKIIKRRVTRYGIFFEDSFYYSELLHPYFETLVVVVEVNSDGELVIETPDEKVLNLHKKAFEDLLRTLGPSSTSDQQEPVKSSCHNEEEQQ